MNLTPEQLMAAHKASVEALVGMTRQAFSGMEQLLELNLNLTKTVLADAHQLSLDSLSAKDSQELLALQANLLAPMTHKILAYQQELAQMAQSVGGSMQVEVPASWSPLTPWANAENLSPPLGNESMFNAFKAAIETGSHAMECVQQALQGASEVAGSTPARSLALAVGKKASTPVETAANGKPGFQRSKKATTKRSR